MPIIKITAEDRMKSRVAEPGWYNATITEMKMQGSKSQKSINFFTDFTVSDDNMNGKVVPCTFNTETNSGSVLGSMQFKPYSELIKLISVVEGIPVDKVPDSYDTDDLIGKKLCVKLAVHIADGTPMNIIEGFVPFGQGASQQAPF